MLPPLSKPFRNCSGCEGINAVGHDYIAGYVADWGREDADHSGIRLYAVGEPGMIGGGGRLKVGA